MKNPILLQKPTSDHCGPGYVGKSKYLETKNLLSEFDTEEKRLTVLRNLGILNNQIDIVLELGDDTSVVMSLKAVTDAINNNKNIEIYESENNLPTSAATGRIAAVVYQTNNETVNRLYFKNEEAWKSINDVKIVDAENKLDPSAPLGTISVVAINKLQKFLSDLNCPRDLKTAEDFELLEFIEEPLVINAPVHVDIDLSEELITLTFAQDFYIPKQTNSTDILPNLPHYIYIGKFDTLTSDGAAWGIYHFSQTLGGGIIAEYDSNGDRISYNEMQIQDLNLYLKYQYRYKYWVSKKTIPNYDIVNTFIAVGQTVMTTVPYIKDFDKWTSLLNADILYIDEAKLSEYEIEQDGTTFLIRVPKDRLKEITRGVDFIDFKNYSRICVGNNIYPLFLEDGMYTTPIRTIIEEDYALQIWPMVISGFSDSYTFLSGYVEVELAGITIADDYSDLSSDEKVGSIATTQELVDDTKTVSEYYELIQDNFPTRLREVVIDPKESTDVRVEGYHYLEMYVYNLSIDGKPVSLASPLGKLTISEFNPNYSSENAVWGIYCSISSISLQESAVLEYDLNGNRITWNPDALTAFNNSKLVGNAGGKVYGGYISTFDPYLSVLDGILYFSNTTTKTTLYLKHDLGGWEKYHSPIKNNSIKLEHLSDEVTKTLKGVSIYNSENSLPVNSKAGNIATVVKNETQYVNLSALYQFEDSDFNSEHVEYVADISALKEKGTRVSNIECLIPKNFDELASWLNNYFEESSYIGLVNLDKTNETDVHYYDVYVGLSSDDEPVYQMTANLCASNAESDELAIFWSCAGPDSPIMVDEESIRDFNNTLAQGEWVYCNQPGDTNLELHDKFIKVALEVKSTSLHLKTLDSWERINNVKIVDSVDKLDRNTPQGSLASVAVNTLREVSFSELYQPTEEDFSSPTPPIDKLPKVNRISIIVPNPSIEPPEFEIELYSEDFNPANGVGSIVVLRAGIAFLTNLSDYLQNREFELLIYNEVENTLTINEKSLAELNNILSEKGYVYGGTYGPLNENGDYGLIDSSVSNGFYRVIDGVQKTDLCIKDVEGWKKINDVKIVDSVDKLDPNAPQGTLATVAVNTFRKIKWSEVYQPTEEELNQPFEEIVGKLTRISKFEVTPPESMDIMPSEDDWYIAHLFSGTTGGGFGIGSHSVGFFGEVVDDMMMEAYSEDDANYAWEVYQDIINAANKELNKTPFYYINSTLNDEPVSLPSFLDDIIHIYTGEVSTELYIKTDKGWTLYKESDTVYIDYIALDEYDMVNLYEDVWYYEIPINEFPKVSRGVPFDELSKCKFVAFDGYVEPLMSDGSSYWTPQYIHGDNEIWYGQHLEIFVDGEYVYVGDYVEYGVEMPCKIYDNVEYLPEDARVGTVASVRYEIEKEINIPISNIPTNSRLTKGIVIEAPQTVTIPNKSTVNIYFNGESGSYAQGWKLGLTFTDSNVNIHWNGGGNAEPNHTIAVYNISSGSFSEFNQSELDNVNRRLTTPAIMGGYWWLYSKPSDEDIPYIDQFIKTSSMMNLIKCLIYIKNEEGWEEYDKATKDKVSALESKVAELEAKLLELLNSLQN